MKWHPCWNQQPLYLRSMGGDIISEETLRSPEGLPYTMF